MYIHMNSDVFTYNHTHAVPFLCIHMYTCSSTRIDIRIFISSNLSQASLTHLHPHNYIYIHIRTYEHVTTLSS